jgi:hypothetical protein
LSHNPGHGFDRLTQVNPIYYSLNIWKKLSSNVDVSIFKKYIIQYTLYFEFMIKTVFIRKYVINAEYSFLGKKMDLTCSAT